jgi:Tol biopolymer transport system component
MPDARFATLTAEPGAIYSSSPAMSHDEMFYESIGASSYVIRNGSKSFEFPGEAFHPAVPDSGAPVFFESLQRSASQIMRFNPLTGEPRPVPTGVVHPEQPAVSHNGALLAFVSEGRLYVFDGAASRAVPISGRATDPSFVPGDGSIVFVSDHAIVDWNFAKQTTVFLLKSRAPLASPSISPDGRTLLFSALRESNWQVWTKTLATGEERRLTAGPCNNSSPVWRPGSQRMVFASDCGRGIGLPALRQSP